MQNKKCAVHISSDKGQFQQNTIIIKQPSNKDNLPRKLSDDATIQGIIVQSRVIISGDVIGKGDGIGK